MMEGMETRTWKHFVGGQWVGSRKTRDVVYPWDASKVGTVALAGPESVERAIASAVHVADELARTPAWRRAAWLEGIVDGIRARRDELVDLIVHEGGKPRRFAEGEVARAIQTFTLGVEAARSLGGEVIPIDAVESGEGRIGITRRFPKGPVAAITPFNFPLNLVAHKVAPALAAGCPLVLKPADETPLSSLVLAEIAEQAGVPAGAFNVVPCEVEDAAPLTEDPRLKVLTFTGSARVGWQLKSRAGKKQVLLELGGNAAAIVHADADLDRAVERCTFGAFAHAGQVCISVQRLYVHRGIYEQFVDRLVAAAEDTPTGDPDDAATVCGPLRADIDADRLEQWITEAREAGATIRCGGTRNGRMIPPTVITGADPRLPISCQEAFGPVVVVYPYDDLDAALDEVNDSDYGLQAGIFTNDLAATFRAFERLEVGGVIHNDVPTFRVDHMPYGGVKDSGLGREGVRYALDDLTELRVLVLKPRA